MQVRRVWSRAARSLLAKRTRTVTGDGLRKVWRWRLGVEPNDAAVLEARQYLAADLDVEAIYLDVAHYGAYGIRTSAGMWEPGDEAYDANRLAKQRLVTTPYLSAEVNLAVSAAWVDRARRGKTLAVKLVGKARATAEPLARKGYRVVRDRVTREQAVKHLRRAPAPAPDLSGTHTVRANLTFTPEQNARWEGIREQLVRAGVLVGEVDDIPDAEADSDGRKPEQPSRRRCIDPDNTVHLVHPFLTLPLCGKPLNHEERGARIFYTADQFTPDDSRMCDVCARMSAALRGPSVDLALWGDRTSWAFKDGPRVAQQDAPWIPDVTDRESMGEALQDALSSDFTASCPGCSRAYGTEGVTCHRTPADGWACEIAIKDHPLTQAGVSKMTVWKLSVVQQHLIDTVKKNGGRARLSDLGALRGHFTLGQVSLALKYLLDEGLLLTGDGMYVLLPTSPTPVEEASADTPPDLDDGDEMPVLKVASDAKVYLPKLMVEAGMVTSQKNGAALLAEGQVTIDGKPCVGKLTYRPVELVGFVVELGGEGTLGSLPRIYDRMTRRFRVMLA